MRERRGEPLAVKQREGDSIITFSPLEVLEELEPLPTHIAVEVLGSKDVVEVRGELRRQDHYRHAIFFRDVGTEPFPPAAGNKKRGEQ